MMDAPSSDVQNLALRLVSAQTEGGKLDFKRDLVLTTAEQKMEFCKDLSAIANTDDDRLDGHGFIIIGADRGNLRGGVTAWSANKVDNFTATLTMIAKTYLAPVPIFSFFAFEEPSVGNWGVIVIPPSSSQPHIFIKEYSGNPAKHEWFVRLNDTTERAGVLDYARVLQKAVHRNTRPLETEVQRLTLRVERLEDGQVTSAQLLEALSARSSTASRSGSKRRSKAEGQTRAEESVALPSLLRRELSTPESRVEELLAQESLRLRALMLEDREENPQRFTSDASDELIKPIAYMESSTREFAEAVATISRHDSNLRFSGGLVEAFAIIAEQPALVGGHWQHAEELRLYPLLLSLYSLAFVSAGRNDGRLLRRVLDCEFRVDRRDRTFPLIYAVRSARSAKDVFNLAMRQSYFEPIAMRLLSVIQTWCGPFLTGRSAEDVFYQAEFGLALEHMRLETVFHGTGMPLPGAYLYANRGEAAVRSMLKRRSPFMLHLFGEDVERRLGLFDKNVGEIVSQESFDRGFSDTTTSAWSNQADEER